MCKKIFSKQKALPGAADVGAGAAAGCGADQVGAAGGGYAIGLLGAAAAGAGAEYENGLGPAADGSWKNS